jgi:hypothetical protein
MDRGPDEIYCTKTINLHYDAMPIATFQISPQRATGVIQCRNGAGRRSVPDDTRRRPARRVVFWHLWWLHPHAAVRRIEFSGNMIDYG